MKNCNFKTIVKRLVKPMKSVNSPSIDRLDNISKQNKIKICFGCKLPKRTCYFLNASDVKNCNNNNNEDTNIFVKRNALKCSQPTIFILTSNLKIVKNRNNNKYFL